jgi:hypothetical protein
VLTLKSGGWAEASSTDFALRPGSIVGRNSVSSRIAAIDMISISQTSGFIHSVKRAPACRCTKSYRDPANRISSKATCRYQPHPHQRCGSLIRLAQPIVAVRMRNSHVRAGNCLPTPPCHQMNRMGKFCKSSSGGPGIRGWDWADFDSFSPRTKIICKRRRASGRPDLHPWGNRDRGPHAAYGQCSVSELTLFLPLTAIFLI